MGEAGRGKWTNGLKAEGRAMAAVRADSPIELAAGGASIHTRYSDERQEDHPWLAVSAQT